MRTKISLQQTLETCTSMQTLRKEWMQCEYEFG